MSDAVDQIVTPLDTVNQKHFGPIYVVEDPNFGLHPLCTVFPRASDDEVNEMCKITRHLGGVINNPVTVWLDPARGVKEMLDGGNRQAVARICKVSLEVRDFLGDYHQARQYVLVRNLTRRHLTGTQKAAALIELSKIDIQRNYIPPNIRDTIAAQAGIKADQVRKIEKVASADPGALQRLRDGTSSLREETKKSQEGDPTGKNLIGLPNRPETPPEAIIDNDGTPVPDNLLDVWKVRGKFRAARASFQDSLTKLREVIREPGGHGLSVEYERWAKNLIQDLDAKMPALVCCHCWGSGVSKSEISNKRWRAHHDENNVGKCYCCKARGYLLKDEPRPDDEWVVKKAS